MLNRLRKNPDCSCAHCKRISYRDKKDDKKVLLRVPPGLLESIDQALVARNKARPYYGSKLSRNDFLKELLWAGAPPEDHVEEEGEDNDS